MTDLRYYAGIGSRETPPDIQRIMTNCARLMYERGWILRSGAALGADAAFETGVNKKNRERGCSPAVGKEILLPWRRYNQSQSSLCPENYPFTQQELDLAAELHPAWDRCSAGARSLHTRNIRILLGVRGDAPVRFVICWTKNGKMTGGTGQALRLAQRLDIPIFNLGAAQTPEDLRKILTEVVRASEVTT